MDIGYFFAIVAAVLVGNALSVVYFFCLNAMQKAQNEGRHPPWGVILGGLLAPIIAAASLFMFVTA